MNIDKILAILESHFVHEVNIKSYELSEYSGNDLKQIIYTFEKYKNALECLALVQKMKADKNEQSQV
jgi:hypothetical protein